MIIIGYPGIGKTTISQSDLKFIDLESSCFNINEQGKKHPCWSNIYANIAKKLSDDGYIVFVSSHLSVSDSLARICDENEVYVCRPSEALRNQWVKKLKDRYETSDMEKDLRAYTRAKDYYKDDIELLHSNAVMYGFKDIIINDMDYDLKALLTQYTNL